MKAKLIVKNAVRNEHKAGRTQVKIAKKYGLPLQMVRGYLKEEGENSMGKHNKQDLIDTITAERLDGMSLRQIAVKHDLSPKTIRNYLGEAKVKLDKPGRESRKVAAVRAYEEGKTSVEIAEELDLCLDSVRYYIRDDKAKRSGEEIYKEIGSIGVLKRHIKEWAIKQTGKYLHTPEGTLICTEAYPNLLVFHKKWGSVNGRTTFTTAEIYYMNKGGTAC